jgi:hypothetical protein
MPFQPVKLLLLRRLRGRQLARGVVDGFLPQPLQHLQGISHGGLLDGPSRLTQSSL